MKSRKPQEGYYAGLTQLSLPEGVDELDLGKGLMLRSTYAHLMQTNIMAFNPPRLKGEHHAGPWKATSTHAGWDVTVELSIPRSYEPPHGLSYHDVGRTITVLMRLVCDPGIRLLVESNHSLSNGTELDDNEIRIAPVESTPQYISLGFINPEDTEHAGARVSWVKANWKNAVDLMGTHGNFRLAMDAFALSTFVPHHALTLISLWGALEALFSPSTSELRFRVSILIASYLHPPGPERANLQKEIFDLYDMRSAAAHGKPKHNLDHLAKTFNLIKSVLTRMIEDNFVPTKAFLNERLMGVEVAT
ncbi:hypothetical protein BJG93_02170 [Paraburkholderia sprentiae WSM5005]|uniref:Uncharacterized protein n=1 Tax=Paraburkholderia sprentiae WSM5005 TaxID=754502 RepID=A0A1I9YDE7_9BURK|nr:HEPN domain-containing protein [Paraburkholderia sprentiae]APA84330.1 hypothetical protein BJG93_02170 [Paraburkholderia sprentiae WSM5005]